MNDEYLIDNHKLMYHPQRVSDWLNNKKIYPIYCEISLTSACNHRCVFCAPRFFLNYKPEFIDTKTIKKAIFDMSKVGIKSIMLAGEGEPLLHKDIVEITRYIKECGIDVSITTNGILFNENMAKNLLPYLSWIKFSIDAGNKEIYSKLHGTKKSDFNLVLENIRKSVLLNKKNGYNVDIGIQSILFKENIKSLYQLANILKKLKPTYLVVKPFSPHPKNMGVKLTNPTIKQINNFKKYMTKYEGYYNFIYRNVAFNNITIKRIYDECYGQDFTVHINTLGGVSSCVNYIGNNEYSYGNIYNKSFKDIWDNRKRIKPDLSKCRIACRLNTINQYLYDLKSNNVKHVNFI